ncbi:MAG: DNA-directed RNA polymerase subunit omega [Candidatus Eisenbacteria bacterium]|uniref:DNA-directed RNA polymerase subunit omega n=1 Tax=Eiseniibacteriota bacterium TaxID=2212470 RepID=A0A538TLB8_UNCEI|nr:MAG: DNA-directed RNA polymerase subunit omega [Candidatus Eisenbacteria bacterium]
MDEKAGVLRSSNIPSKYELIIVAAKEARRLNELSRVTGLNLGGKVTNVALEEALKGNVLYRYRENPDDVVVEPVVEAEE